jgi:hypothetical protein
MPQPVNSKKKRNIMGDKSPKSNQKKSKQQKTRTDSAEQKKKQEALAKRPTKTK